MLKKLRQGIFLLSCLLLSVALHAQTSVSGKVLDKDNNPLAGVQVGVKGGTADAITGSDGGYTITSTKAIKTLIFTISGYQTQTLNVTGATLDLSMKQLTKDAGDIIVIGYGAKKKGDLTTSVTTVSSKDFQKGAITSPEQLIAGKVAGVQITSNGGAPGSGSVIRIRGGASLNASNDPLIVVDGVPLSNSGIAGAPNALALINPNDIETLTVLKDAAATSIYGSRASNGVIIVTTKKGKRGAPVLNFSTNVAVGTVAKKVDLLSADEFRTYVNANGTNAQRALLGNVSTDWQDEIYANAVTTDNGLSISGTKGKVPYRASLGYLNQQGLLMGDKFQRTSIGINVSPKFLNDDLKVDLNFKTALTNSNFADRGAIGSANSFDPTKTVKSASAKYGSYTEWLDAGNVTGLNGLSARNPVGLLNQRDNTGNTTRIIANVQLDYKVKYVKGLRVTANFGIDQSTGSGKTVINDSAASSYRRAVSGGTFLSGVNNEYKQKQTNQLMELFVNYAKDLKSINSKFDLQAGYTYQDFLTRNDNFADFSFNKTLIPNSTPLFAFSENQNRLISYIGRGNLSLNNKYLISASIRRDGSSRFSPENRWGLFPSASFAWKMKEEGFLKNADKINDLKIRLSYGVTGQQDGIGDYDYQGVYRLSGNNSQYQFGNTFYTALVPNSYDGVRKWEQTASYNAGLDFSLFSNRISGTLDFYLKNTTDLLSNAAQAAGTNFTNFFVKNIGSMENKGVELNVNTVIIKGKDVNLDLNFNVTNNNNKITKLENANDPNFKGILTGGISGGTGQTVQIQSVGSPRSSFYVNKQIYDRVTGKPIENVFEDFNRDGNPNNDLYKFYNPDPTWLLGFSPNLGYKKWNLNFVMRANLGNYVFNNVASSAGTNNSVFGGSGFISNAHRSLLETNFIGTSSSFMISDYYVENASFLRMDNAGLSYNAGTLVKNWKANFRFNANVQNVFIVSNYKGIDPEINGGIDNNIYVRPRTFNFGVNVDFNLK